ncbi:hypothetical protein [Actinophytocola sp.]|uniref:hypothetical protein n=1 Tax=Actinophytocola sp. TaxID=1872138 RepID=UPI003D6C355B
MAYKITHRTAEQQLTFPNREAAERYAEQNGGGRDNWTVDVATQAVTPRERWVGR